MCNVSAQGMALNQTFAVSGGACNVTSLNLTGLADGNVSINVWVNDTVGIVGLNKSYVVQVDTTSPVISYSCSPSTVVQNEVTTCSCVVTDATSGINATLTTYTTNPSTVNTGTYIVGCSATDNIGNSGSGTATYDVGGASNSDGGSSVVPQTYLVTPDQFTAGFSKELKVNDRFKMAIGGEAHYAKLTELTQSTTKIIVTSDPQTAILAVGDVRKFEVTGDNVYDLEITLNSIVSSKASFEVKEISEGITADTILEEEEKEQTAAELEFPEEPVKNKLLWLWIVIVVVLIAVLYFFVFRKKSKLFN